MGSDFFDLDLFAILTAYLLLSYGPTAAAIFALGQGFLIDLFSGGLHGLFSFLYLSVFGGIYLGSKFFNLQYRKGQILVIFLAVLLKRILLLIMLSLFSMKVIFPMSFLSIYGASVIVTGLITPLVFLIFDRLRVISLKKAGDDSAT